MLQRGSKERKLIFRKIPISGKKLRILKVILISSQAKTIMYKTIIRKDSSTILKLCDLIMQTSLHNSALARYNLVSVIFKKLRNASKLSYYAQNIKIAMKHLDFWHKLKPGKIRNKNQCYCSKEFLSQIQKIMKPTQKQLRCSNNMNPNLLQCIMKMD